MNAHMFMKKQPSESLYLHNNFGVPRGSSRGTHVKVADQLGQLLLSDIKSCFLFKIFPDRSFLHFYPLASFSFGELLGIAKVSFQDPEGKQMMRLGMTLPTKQAAHGYIT